jgi:hypothetical protein
MINSQSEFGSCCLIETFSAKAAMPGDPTPLDDAVEAVGVIRAEDVPRSQVRNGIRFVFCQSAHLSATREVLTGRVRGKSLNQGALNPLIDILKSERLEGHVTVAEILPSPN